jgi:Damage-control phosphatase ARMT1-like domain
VVDHLDAALDALCSGRHRLAVLFVDNAGADVLLGMLPFARELLKGGAQVLLAANRGPTINDITAAELLPLLVAAAAADALLLQALQSGALRVVDSGNDLPVIDLRAVRCTLRCDACNAPCSAKQAGGDAVPCCAVLCCAVLCCAVLCCAVLCCAVLCCAGWQSVHHKCPRASSGVIRPQHCVNVVRHILGRA